MSAYNEQALFEYHYLITDSMSGRILGYVIDYAGFSSVL